MITPTESEERFIQTLRALPPDAVEHLIAWTTGLRDLSNGAKIDWSDTWTEEDLADAQAASLARFDETRGAGFQPATGFQAGAERP